MIELPSGWESGKSIRKYIEENHITSDAAMHYTYEERELMDFAREQGCPLMITAFRFQTGFGLGGDDSGKLIEILEGLADKGELERWKDPVEIPRIGPEFKVMYSIPGYRPVGPYDDLIKLEPCNQP